MYRVSSTLCTLVTSRTGWISPAGSLPAITPQPLVRSSTGFWQSYFGTGLVETAEDLGTQSPAPSHPDLLDWLAVELMENDWSLKHLHRLIVTSAAYQQSSHVTPELLEKDPKNRLLSRGPRFRVEGEIVRDIALAASGLLNREIGGPPVYPPAPEFLFKPPVSYGPKQWHTESDDQRYRRALYTFRFRSVPYPALDAFDTPNGDASCVRRVRSNTPLQALTTLNETVFLEAAEALAAARARGGRPSRRRAPRLRLSPCLDPNTRRRGERRAAVDASEAAQAFRLRRAERQGFRWGRLAGASRLDDGHARPVEPRRGDHEGVRGLTRREWLAALAASRAVASDSDFIARDPPLRFPALAEGEAFIEDGSSNILPTIRAWDMGLRGGAHIEATTESVGDGVAARYSFPAGAEGRIVHERTKVDQAALDRYEGLSFWVKGDGSAARGVASFGDYKIETATEFSVANREWRKVFLPWSEFDPPIRGEVRHLGFSIKRNGANGAIRFVFDKLRLYTTPSTEAIHPTIRENAPSDLPAAAYLAAADAVQQTRRRIENRESATILFAGDSVTAGAQLYYASEPTGTAIDRERRWSADHLYGLRAGHEIATQRGYRQAAFAFTRWDRKAEQWVRVLRSVDGLYPRFDAAPWAEQDRSLRTIVYGAGAQESSFALEQSGEYLAHQPNLVVYQFAGNDLYKERRLEPEFGRNLAGFVARCKSAGAEVVLMTPPPMLHFTEPTPREPYFRAAEPWAEYIRNFAAENDCALVDARRAFLSRGLHHAGDLYSDWAHPNHRGHHLLARLVEELLAPNNLTIWDDLPPR